MIHRLEFRGMGCQISGLVDAEVPGPRLERLPAWFDGWERCLSRFQEHSELNRLNRSNGEAVRVSRTLWQVSKTALDAYRMSGGLVTPLILAALESAGYRQSWESMPAAPHLRLESPPAPAPPLESIQWQRAARTIRLPAGVRLDFGGIAKGWAAQQAVQRLKAYGPALVDAGGDIAISGPQSNGEPWPVGVADPFRPESDLELLRLGRCGVATSGRDFRRWRQGDVWQHHVIDPRSGRPAETDLLSVTVVAETVTEAETAAKTVLILGSREGLNWLEDHPGQAGLLVREDGVSLYSQRMEQLVWSKWKP